MHRLKKLKAEDFFIMERNSEQRRHPYKIVKQQPRIHYLFYNIKRVLAKGQQKYVRKKRIRYFFTITAPPLFFFSPLPYILYIVYSTHLWSFQAGVTIIYLAKRL